MGILCSLALFSIMNIVKLTRYYVIRELSPEKTLKILKIIKGINVDNLDNLSDGIKRVRKVVRIAVGRRFRCTNSELIEAFLKIIDTLPMDEYYQIASISNNIETARQK